MSEICAIFDRSVLIQHVQQIIFALTQFVPEQVRQFWNPLIMRRSQTGVLFQKLNKEQTVASVDLQTVLVSLPLPHRTATTG